MIENTYLKLKLLKRKIPFVKALYPYEGNSKSKRLKNSLIRKFTSPFNLIILNNTNNISNSFHRQTSLKNIIFSVKKALIEIYIFCLVYTYSFFSSLKPWQCTEWVTHQQLSQMLRTRRFSTPFYIFASSLKLL